jgi:hypothetical protein
VRQSSCWSPLPERKDRPRSQYAIKENNLTTIKPSLSRTGETTANHNPNFELKEETL